LYLSRDKKFAVDAKSTKNKLSGISSGRLASHRSKIGAEYTIVVTPRYVPAVLDDIRSSPVVIIRASTFSEYLYNHIERDIREIDYEDFDSIIINRFGEDISKEISVLTISKFATKK
jgi:type II restriction enzyme